MDNVIVPKTTIQADVLSETSRINPNDVIPTLKKYMIVDGLDYDGPQKTTGPYFYDGRHNKIFLDLFSFVASNPLGMNHQK
jgi:L-lysine 6-transaminase